MGRHGLVNVHQKYGGDNSVRGSLLNLTALHDAMVHRRRIAERSTTKGKGQQRKGGFNEI
jgi:hypothetical protein